HVAAPERPPGLRAEFWPFRVQPEAPAQPRDPELPAFLGTVVPQRVGVEEAGEVHVLLFPDRTVVPAQLHRAPTEVLGEFLALRLEMRLVDLEDRLPELPHPQAQAVVAFRPWLDRRGIGFVVDPACGQSF